MNRSLFKRGQAWLLFMPQLLVTTLLMIGVIVGMVQSFGIIPSLGLTDFTTDYYRETLANPRLIEAMVFSLRIALGSSFLSLLFGLGIIYIWISAVGKTQWTESLLRIPIIIPHIIVALFAMQFLGRTGILARLFYALGFDQAQSLFNQVLYSDNAWGIIIAFLWKEVPFVVFYVYPMVAAVGSSLGQAARTLGANHRQAFLRIVLPLSKQTIFAAFFIIFMYSLGSYELPALLGPTTPKALPVMAYEAYGHPDLHHRPYAMAYNGILLTMGLVLSSLFYGLISWPQLKKARQVKRRAKHEA